MRRFPNLISDSLLIADTIDLLRSFGGTASATSVVDFVMKIRNPPLVLAIGMVSDLIERDPRLRLNGETVELVADGFDERGLDATEFVVFDLETTGAKAPPCRVTEIGAYRVRNDKIVEDFQALVNPGMPIPPFITSLTGISDDMVRDAPPFADILPAFLEFIGDSVLVAHNSGFDMRFLNHEIGLVFEDYRLANPCLCTVQLSRRFLPDIANHKLKTVAEHYAIDLRDHHRAAADARATAEIFINLLQRMQLDGLHDLAAVKQLSHRKRSYAGR